MKNETLGEQAFAKLKNDILSGYYVPGERLLFEKVTERLGVSMTPLKNAFHRLEQEGLVKVIPRKGTYVTQLSDADILQYSQIRLALESLAVDLICNKNAVDEKNLAALLKINAKIQKALGEKSQKECILYDTQFHLLLVRMSGNERLVQLLNQFPLGNFFVFMGKGEKFIEHGSIMLENHDQIVEALRRRDRSAIKRILERNIFLPYDQDAEDR